MGRRPNRQRRQIRQPQTLQSAVLRLTGGRPFFIADRYTVDGGTGNVGSFVDLNDSTHTLAQAVGAAQVAVPAAHADFGGRLCGTFAGASYYVSSRAASTWNYLHNGTGMEVVCVFTPTGVGAVVTNVIWGTVNGGSVATQSGAGFSWYPNTGNALHGWFIANGTATQPIFQITGANQFAVNTPTYSDISYIEAGAPNEFIGRCKSTALSSLNTASAPSAVDPQHTLYLGGNSAGAELGNFRWRMLAFFPQLTADQRALVQQYIRADSGIAP